MTSSPSSSRPFFVLVDDDPNVLAAIQRDIRSRYGGRYDVIAYPSGGEALEATRELKRRDGEVAVFLVDQRMPEMTGLEFLRGPSRSSPSAAGSADCLLRHVGCHPRINEVGSTTIIAVDPPKRSCTRRSTSCSTTGRRPPPLGETVRVIGRWSALATQIKEFLRREPHPVSDARLGP